MDPNLAETTQIMRDRGSCMFQAIRQKMIAHVNSIREALPHHPNQEGASKE
jgi:hypothetical protein